MKKEKAVYVSEEIHKEIMILKAKKGFKDVDQTIRYLLKSGKKVLKRINN